MNSQDSDDRPWDIIKTATGGTVKIELLKNLNKATGEGQYRVRAYEGTPPSAWSGLGASDLYKRYFFSASMEQTEAQQLFTEKCTEYGPVYPAQEHISMRTVASKQLEDKSTVMLFMRVMPRSPDQYRIGYGSTPDDIQFTEWSTDYAAVLEQYDNFK